MSWIILDRDGVINHDSDTYIKSPDEWLPIPGSLSAIARLNAAGYRIAVLTNQSGLARGLFDQDALDAIHAKFIRALQAAGGQIDVLLYCPHGPDDACDCRKPLPGLFHRLAQQHDVDLRSVFAIGDSYRDLVAAIAVEAKPVLVKTGKGLRTLAKHNDLDCPVFDDLQHAVDYILIH